MRDLAKKAGIHHNTVFRAEALGARHGHAVAQMLRTMEEAGVIFIPENGEGPGVRLRKNRQTAGERAKSSGPATDAIEKMEADIAADRRKR